MLKNILKWFSELFTNGNSDPLKSESDFNFGCYESFYNSGISYLGLLNLGDDEEVIGSIRTLGSLSMQDGWESDTVRLLSDLNWRSHLAPLVSYLSSDKKSESIEGAIWQAVVSGSWVSPQLISGLKICDYDFIKQLPEVLAAGVKRPVDSMLKLHVATGPGCDKSRLGKILNSLKGLGIVDELPLEREVIEALIKTDIDGADAISKDWYASISSLIKRAQPDGCTNSESAPFHSASSE